MIAWRRASWDNVKRNFLWPAAASLAFGLFLFVGKVEFLPLLGFTLLAFVVATILYDTALRRCARADASPAKASFAALVTLARRNQRRYGGLVVHLGVVLIMMGIAGSMTYSIEKDATLAVNQSLEIGKYKVQFEGLTGSQQPTHFRVEGAFRVFHNGQRRRRGHAGAEILSHPTVAHRPRRASEQLERRYLSDPLGLQRSEPQSRDAQGLWSARW